MRLATAALLLSTATLGAQPAPTRFAGAYDDVDRVFREYVARAHVPGAAWGVIVDGRLAHVGVTGYRDVAAKAPVDTNTVFRIASMTKSFTAMSILKLRDEGKLSLDDPAERWVPELQGLEVSRRPTRRRSRSATYCRTRQAFRRTTRGATSSSRSRDAADVAQ